MSNLARYTNLHRMATDLNVEAEIDKIEDSANNEDRQVVAAVGASVMALGMGMVEVAGNPDVKDEAIDGLLALAAGVAPATANGLEAFRAAVPEALDGDDSAVFSIMGLGLREVVAYHQDRLTHTRKIQNSSLSGMSLPADDGDAPVDEEEPID